MRGKKTGRVDELTLVGFPFDKKRPKMTKGSNACQSFRITAKALKLSGIIISLMYFSEK